MNSLKKYLIPIFCICLGCVSCEPTQMPETPDKTGDETTEHNNQDEDAGVGLFEKYTFVLDRSQVPTLGGYGLDRDVPQAKLLAFNSKGKVIKDVLAKNGIKVDLGYDCRLQKVGGHFFIFADDNSLQDDVPQKMVTVLDAHTLKVVSKTLYDFNYPDFIAAINQEKAIIGGNKGYNLYTLDLKTGVVSDFARTAYDPLAGNTGIYYGGYLFVALRNEPAIAVYDVNDATKMQKIKVAQPIHGIYRVSDEFLMIRTESDLCYLLSMKSKHIEKEFHMDFEQFLYSLRSAMYDAPTERLYIAGTKAKVNRNKIFFFDLKQSYPREQLFYTIPPKDFNRKVTFRGNIMMGINHKKDEMYIGHLYSQDFINNPNGNGLRARRLGYLSTISNVSGKPIPITSPDKKVKIEDMGEFSPFFIAEQ